MSYSPVSMSNQFLQSLNYHINVLTAQYNETQNDGWVVKYHNNNYEIAQTSISVLMIVDYMRSKNISSFINFKLTSYKKDDNNILYVLDYIEEEH